MGRVSDAAEGSKALATPALEPPLPPDPNIKEELITEKDVNERELMDRRKMDNIDLKKSLFLWCKFQTKCLKKRDSNILERIFSTFSVNNTVMSV